MTNFATPQFIKHKFYARGIEHDGYSPKVKKLWDKDFAEMGGFHPGTKQLKPLTVGDNVSLHEVLDNVTAAVESGLVSSTEWPSQLFATEEDLRNFLDELSAYDDCYRIVDRWWQAIACLAKHENDEEGFITCQEIADALADYAFGELKAFAKPKPVKVAAKPKAAVQKKKVAVKA